MTAFYIVCYAIKTDPLIGYTEPQTTTWKTHPPYLQQYFWLTFQICAFKEPAQQKGYPDRSLDPVTDWEVRLQSFCNLLELVSGKHCIILKILGCLGLNFMRLKIKIKMVHLISFHFKIHSKQVRMWILQLLCIQLF